MAKLAGTPTKIKKESSSSSKNNSATKQKSPEE